MERRAFLRTAAGGAVAAVAGIRPSQAQAPLPDLAPAADPYARLQGGAPHHLTPDQEAQRVFDSPAPAGSAGRWIGRAALPRPRGAAAAVVLNGAIHLFGGASEPASERASVGWHEVYDPATDAWQHHAPMPTPRHAVAATTIGDWIFVAGGGAVLGGAVQSAVHEAFTLA